MDKNAEEVTRAIAIKLLGGIEGFKLTKLEINVGRPIYVLIDELGKARDATYEENHEILMRSNPDEEDDED